MYKAWWQLYVIVLTRSFKGVFQKLKVKTVSLNAYTFRKKSSIFAQPVSARNWPVNKLTRETRDVDVANVAKSNIFFPSFDERKTLTYSLDEMFK